MVDQVFVKIPHPTKKPGVQSVMPIGDGALGSLGRNLVALPRTPYSSIKNYT